jgi:endonuclease/exonuclease/phosphatase family metal-dependent hydrolase
MHRVRVSTGRGDFWLYNVHLPNPVGESREESKLSMLRRFTTIWRQFELDWLIEATAQRDGPYVLAGDFNIAAGSYEHRRFPVAWNDAYTLAGRGFGHTFPSPMHEDTGDSKLVSPIPLIRIDYVLTSSQLRPVGAWLDELVASDHLAVIADLELPGR